MRPLHLVSKRIAGADYRPSCGKCDMPPWEACACSSLLCKRTANALQTHSEGIAERLNAEAQARLLLLFSE